MRKFVALVLDDQPIEIRLLEGALNNRGFDVLKCHNQEEAEEKLHEHCPHLLVVDINLSPTTNGLDWLEKVRQGPYKELPTIVMSGVQDPAQVKRAIALGIQDYILKPSDMSVVSNKLVKLAQKIEGQPIYMKKFIETSTMKVSMESDAMAMAVSESGVAICSHLQSKELPFEVQLNTDLFETLSVAKPSSFFVVNTIGEANRGALGMPFRSYIQTKGWSDEDKAKVRDWAKSNKLKRSF